MFGLEYSRRNIQRGPRILLCVGLKKRFTKTSAKVEYCLKSPDFFSRARTRPKPRPGISTCGRSVKKWIFSEYKPTKKLTSGKCAMTRGCLQSTWVWTLSPEGQPEQRNLQQEICASRELDALATDLSALQSSIKFGPVLRWRKTSNFLKTRLATF